MSDHLADARSAAKALGAPVENILGLSALESDWGLSGLAADHHNFFGLHCPAHGAKNCVPAKENAKIHVAVFDNFQQSAASFISQYGGRMRGLSDPTAFAVALQDKCGFGIDMITGKKMTKYVYDVSSTIRHMRKRISEVIV